MKKKFGDITITTFKNGILPGAILLEVRDDFSYQKIALTKKELISLQKALNYYNNLKTAKEQLKNRLKS